MSSPKPMLPPVLYEDEALIAFNKPSGLLVAPDRYDKELVNLMGLVHEQLSPKWFNVHRIDRDTSGVLLCAKTKGALDKVCGMFQARRVTKEYLALTRGVPESPSGSVDLPIVPDLQQPGRMRTARSGKPAQTVYEVAEAWRRFALLRCRPLTGRQHQVRVHLASIRCPILGDAVYGNGRGLLLSEIKRKYKAKENEPERPLIGRLALHASRLTFAHPETGSEIAIEAPLPKDFELALKYLRKFGGRVREEQGSR